MAIRGTGHGGATGQGVGIRSVAHGAEQDGGARLMCWSQSRMRASTLAIVAAAFDITGSGATGIGWGSGLGLIHARTRRHNGRTRRV